MKKYKETKFSGLDWLGAIPSHWQVKRLKNIARINPLKNIPDDADEMTTFLPMEKVSEKGEIDCSLKRPVKDLLTGFTYFEKDDIILAKITPCFENGKGAYLDKLDTPFGFGSTEFHVIRTLEKLDSTFLYYVTTSNLFRDLGEASMTGSGGQRRVPTSFVENFPLAFPPLPEQHAIAAYLDRKTTQLDTLLAQKEALLHKLHLKRQALINEAVTQGLDLAAPRKPSGVAWLGDVPAHWEVKRLKYVARINPLKNIADDADDRVTFLPMDKVSEKGDIDCTQKRPVKDLLSGFTYFEKNDVIIAKITPCFENGKGAYLNKLDTDFGFGSTEFHVIRASEQLHGAFLYYLTTSNAFRDAGEGSMTGSGGQRRVPTSFVENFPLALPSHVEQQAIVNFIEAKTGKINEATAAIHAQIQTLKAYRQSLISEVVTGKVDVLSAVPVAPEADLPLWMQ